MKIAVIGCGAIGGLFLGYLSQNEDALGVVKDYQKEALDSKGLIIRRGQSELEFKPKTEIWLKEEVDLAIFATKINDLEEAARRNQACLKNALILSAQNGVRAESILKKFFPSEKILSSVVMFGATFYPPNKVVCNFKGDLILGSVSSKATANLKETAETLNRYFPVKFIDNIKGAKYLKLFINLNNCLPAVLGKSMQESFSDLEVSKLAIELNKEAYRVVEKAGINLESLPGYPKERIQGLVSKPSGQSAQIFSKIMSGLSQEPLYGSILQSLKRRRPSEIDFINGEIVCLAKETNQEAPLNQKIVELVHQVEKNGFLSKQELIRDTSHLNL